MKLWPFKRNEEHAENLDQIQKIKRRQQKVELELRAIQMSVEKHGRT